MKGDQKPHNKAEITYVQERFSSELAGRPSLTGNATTIT
jgi:hypothetical protein